MTTKDYKPLLNATKDLLSLWKTQAVVGSAPDAEAWRHINRAMERAEKAIAEIERAARTS